MKLLDRTALVLVIVGALNWLLVGLFDFNLVSAIFGAGTTFETIVYVIVGLAGLWCIKYFSYTPGGYRRNRDL